METPILRTLAELLDRFLAFEAKELDRQDIRHAPTIGAMYEGLTRAALERALPDGANLSVVSGFARGADGRLSRQLDCMLVTGDGESVPYTHAKVFPIDNVIAVVEVKKSLHSDDLASGHDNLRSVVMQGSDPVVRTATIRRSFQTITGVPLPDDHKLLPVRLAMIRHVLIVDASLPVRVVFGYHGFTTETALRRGLAEHLGAIIGRKGYGIASLPNVMLNRTAAVIKANGMPWPGRMDDGWWRVLLTTALHSPVGVFLEIIFSRLHTRGIVDASWFGEDLDREAWNILLDARFLEDRNGWEFRLAPSEIDDGEAAVPVEQWEPEFLSQSQFVLIKLAESGPVKVSDIATSDADRAQIDADLAILVAKGLVGRNIDDGETFSLLVERLGSGVLPDGRFFAGENNSGRVERWMIRLMSASRRDDSPSAAP